MLEIYREMVRVIEAGEPAVLATIISAQGSTPRKAGAKMLIKADGSFVGTIGGGGTEHQMLQKVPEVLRSGQPQLVNFDLSGRDGAVDMICGGQMQIFLEPVVPAETLYLFGAGHVSQATATVAKMLGFRVVVIDPRPDYNNPERFPRADALITEDYEKAFPQLNIDERSYIVIYTTGHVNDEQCLHFAVGTPARYIGMIGSQKKSREVKEHLRQKGVAPERLAQVHSPIGLEIGAETPEEIALSILAEITRIRRG